LMMVVAILGILAVIAIPRYISYVYRSKTAEAVGFLADIKSHQESYRADFGQYCDVSQTPEAWWPTSTPNDKPDTWLDTGTIGQRWLQLGSVPPGRQVLFRYVTVAGLPGTSNTPDQRGFTSALGYTGSDFWFVSRAKGDLDADGTTVIFESYSHGQGLYIDKAAGWE
ncbi:MAG TPA: hypothetical protein VG963_31725, partial [Polyangiaceae bacterium]|nr:hypothetical protein [Polyangiaceae bacterium]